MSILVFSFSSCRNMSSLLTLKLSKNFLLLAAYIATGKIVALGPLILVTLYRAITHASSSMLSKNKSTLFGPLWILQCWLVHYFSFLSSHNFCTFRHHFFPKFQPPTPLSFGCCLLNYSSLSILENLSPLLFTFKNS